MTNAASRQLAKLKRTVLSKNIQTKWTSTYHGILIQCETFRGNRWFL